MHLLAASRSLPCHAIGGMESLSWDLFTEFVRLGHRMTVLTTELPRGATVNETEGIDVVPIQGARPGAYSRGWWRGSLRYAAGSRKLRDVDAVLSISVAAASLARLKSTSLAVPFILQAHGSSWGEIVSKWRTRSPLAWLRSARNLLWLLRDFRIYRDFDALILVGAGLRGEFERLPGRWLAPRAPRLVISNGVDTERFHPDETARNLVRRKLGWADTDRVIVSAGRLQAQKGVARAIAAVAAISERPASRRTRLLVIGSGPEEAALRRQAAQTTAIGTVAFIGAIPRECLPEWLAAGDCFVLMSMRREGLPISLLEALATGLPCVCSAELHGALPAELPIRYVAARDVNAVAGTLDAVLDSARAATSRLPMDFTLRHCAEAYIDAIYALRHH